MRAAKILTDKQQHIHTNVLNTFKKYYFEDENILKLIITRDETWIYRYNLKQKLNHHNGNKKTLHDTEKCGQICCHAVSLS